MTLKRGGGLSLLFLVSSKVPSRNRVPIPFHIQSGASRLAYGLDRESPHNFPAQGQSLDIYLRSAGRMRVHNVMVVRSYRNLCSRVERAPLVFDSRVGQCYLTPFGKARKSRAVFVLKR